MALFEVPGWDTPKDGPSSSPSKKRKRPPSGNVDSKLQSAEINLEKLMKKLDGKPGHEQTQKSKLRKSDAGWGNSTDEQRKVKKSKVKVLDDRRPSSTSSRASTKPGHERTSTKVNTTSTVPSMNKDKNRKRKAKHSSSDQSSKQVQAPPKHAESSQADASTAQLTSLQENMKKSLDGARFR